MQHSVLFGDARRLDLQPQSVHLTVTFLPYWTLKKYPEIDGQLGEDKRLQFVP